MKGEFQVCDTQEKAEDERKFALYILIDKMKLTIK